jgi:hypothetical protein
MKQLLSTIVLLCNLALLYGQSSSLKLNEKLPNTGISGLYETMVGTNDAAYHVKYFAEFGFSVIDSATYTKEQALKMYGIAVALKSYRLQNGNIDSHGLIRLLAWEKPLGNGVGYSEPESFGSRMAVMKTKDIIRIHDIFQMLRIEKQQKWFLTEPLFDDPLRINKGGETNFFKRPIGVRENAAYGEYFTHVFYQRYGYEVPGYGTINPDAPLKTSELTHHDFFVKIDSMQQLAYLQTCLGLKAEGEATIDGDWYKGPKKVFNMPDGYSHWYQGFISPNNICGKLKFFIPRGAKPDRTANQRIGELGITLHSFYTNKLDFIFGLVKKQNLKLFEITMNEFKERSFVFKGPDGVNWQIIEKLTEPKNKPVTKFELVFTND